MSRTPKVRCARLPGAARFGKPSNGSVLLAVVPDAIESAGEIVRHQQRAIPELGDVDRTTEIFAVLIEPAFGEWLALRRRSVLLEIGHHHTRADRHGPVPRAVLRREDRVLVFLREHAPAVEGHTEISRMRGHLDLREDDVGGRLLGLVLVSAGVAAAVPREAEILPGLDGAVELARRLVVAHAVDLVVGEPQGLVLGIEVEADRVANAVGVDFAVLAVPIHANDSADAPRS